MAERSAPAAYIERTASARGDAWWVVPIVTAVVYAAFVIYSVIRGFELANGAWGPYVSPFFSVDVRLPFIPFLGAAAYNGIIPLAFRATCYYYRKSYYRAFFWDPPACAVRERKRHYGGETVFPFNLFNLHRFAFYLATIVVLLLWVDAIRAFSYQGHFYLGLGSIWMLVNVVALSLYTFSCHSFRHLVGGSVDCYSCANAGETRHGLWGFVSRLNKKHGLWAWISLFTVWSTDVLIRLMAVGAISDLRII